MTRRRPRPPTATWAAWAACTKPGKPSLRYQKEGSGRIPLFLSSGFLTVDEAAGKTPEDQHQSLWAWKAMTRGGPWETSRLHQLRGADPGAPRAPDP